MPIEKESLNNFLSYIKSKNRQSWCVVYDSLLHSSIINALSSEIKIERLVDLNTSNDKEIREIDKDFFENKDVGIIIFSLFIHSKNYSPSYLETLKALNIFDTWVEERSLICDEVIDETFNTVFQESPQKITNKIKEITNIFKSQDEFLFEDDFGSCLQIKYIRETASIYDGFQPHEHNIPSGEVAFAPYNIEGNLNFSGWIIGTIPFGQKYGHINIGTLSLQIEKREIVSLHSINERLLKDFQIIGQKNKALWKIVEVGIGINSAVTNAANKSKVGYEWMEKKTGLHLGLGAELTEHIDDYKNRKTHHHIDLVIDSGRLSHNGELLFSW